MLGVIVIIVGHGISNVCSKPDQDCLCFTSCSCSCERDELISSPHSYG